MKQQNLNKKSIKKEITIIKNFIKQMYSFVFLTFFSHFIFIENNKIILMFLKINTHLDKLTKCTQYKKNKIRKCKKDISEIKKKYFYEQNY